MRIPARDMAKLLLVLAASCALVAGCRQRGTTTQPSAAAPIEKRIERGPVQMTIRAGKGSVTIAEQVDLHIAVQAAGGVDVEMPSFGEKLNEFEIMEFRDRSAVPVEQARGEATAASRRWTQDYTLETFLSGDLEIPAITAKFHDKRDPNNVIDGEIASEPFKIEVRSLLAGEFDPNKYRDIKGPVSLPVERGRAWIWWTAGATAAAIVLVLLGLWLRRRSRRQAVPTPLLPHEWAFFALQRLEEDRLIESGRVQEFYFRLSGVVREYIERRFGMMAPERTTPEFLAEMRKSPSLTLDHQQRLGEFLQAADMVKFARYEPGISEVQAALGTARTFVDETTPAPGTDGPSGQGPQYDLSRAAAGGRG